MQANLPNKSKINSSRKIHKKDCSLMINFESKNNHSIKLLRYF